MNLQEAKNKIELLRNKLLDIQKITSFVGDDAFIQDPETGYQHMESTDEMREIKPDLSSQLQSHWVDLQKMVPAGFSIDGNLMRHISFNQAGDWCDISKRDVPRELEKIDEYEKQLSLVEYLESLRPEISRITEIVLNGDIDAALKIVYSSLDAQIRTFTKAKTGESTVPMIGKAFKDGLLIAPDPEHTDSVRNFLQGIMGYYRANIIHHNLPPHRNSLYTSLSLFGLAHEAFWLLDTCSKHQQF